MIVRMEVKGPQLIIEDIEVEKCNALLASESPPESPNDAQTNQSHE
jgi:hypothetical protein